MNNRAVISRWWRRKVNPWQYRSAIGNAPIKAGIVQPAHIAIVIGARVLNESIHSGFAGADISHQPCRAASHSLGADNLSYFRQFSVVGRELLLCHTEK